MTKHLHFDPFSGIAGDMTLGALIHLGVDLEAINQPLQALGFEPGFEITTQPVSRHGIGAIDLKVRVEHTHEHTHAHEHEHAHEHTHEHEHQHEHAHEEQHTHTQEHTHEDGHEHTHEHSHDHDHSHEHGQGCGCGGKGHGHGHGKCCGGKGHEHTHEHSHDHGHSHDHHHRTAKDILALIDKLEAPKRAKQRARDITIKLAEAEGRVHGMPAEDVHFHEVGAVDSIVDMLGTALALEALGIETLSCGPLPISRGYVRCAHGVMPVPAPATAYLLEGLTTVGVDRTGELITPTGAAIVAALCSTFGPPPPMQIQAIGYGAGDREDPKVPNLLRAILAET